MKRILVVDDAVVNRFQMVVLLQAHGYEVITANDGAEAVVCGRRHRPDLVISDILMPVMDGFELCRQWHAEEPLRDIPFLFYTATYSDARDEKLAMDLGADRFVLKSREPQELVKIIEELLARETRHEPTAVASPPRADEAITLREYNEALVRKLKKKASELEVTREALEAALRQSEERWRQIYETEPECVKVVSAAGRLEAMNPAGLKMVGADALDQVCGATVLDLIAPEHRDAFLAMHRSVIGGESRQLQFEIIGLRGRRRWMETHAVPLHNADGTVSQLGITHDITELKQSEAFVNGQKQVLELIASGAPLAESLTALLNVVEGQSADMLCSILLLDADGLHLRHGAAPSLPSEYCRAIDGVAIGPGVGSCGTAAYQRELVIVADIATDPLWADFRDLALNNHLRACWSMPIFDAQQRDREIQASGVLGTFAMYYRQSARPNEHHLRLIDMATHTAAIAINKHQEEAALHATQAALHQSERQLRLFVEHSPAAIAMFDNDMRYLVVSLRWRSDFRLCEEDLIGRSHYDVFPDIPQRWKEIHRRCLGGAVEKCDADPFLRADGTTDWVRWEMRPWNTTHGDIGGVILFVEIITEKVLTQAELQASRERLEMLSRELIATQESERRHLARELHDEIGQTLTGIKLNLRALQQPTQAAKSEALVQDMIGLVDQTLQQVRSLALDLRPSMLDDIGLVAALRWCLDRQAQRAGFGIQFQAEPPDISTSPEIATACFRVAQESLTNIARHAQARQVRVELHQQDTQLELLITDNGVGFDVGAAHGASTGLLGMRERVALVGGQLKIESAPSQGTTIRARFPRMGNC